MKNEIIVVAMLLVAAFFVVAVFIWFLCDKIRNLQNSVDMRLGHLREMGNSQFSRFMQVETELRALERYLEVKYIGPHRRHGKMVKAKGEQG